METERETDTDIFHVLSNFIDFGLQVGKLFLDVMIQAQFLTILLKINNKLTVL